MKEFLDIADKVYNKPSSVYATDSTGKTVTMKPEDLAFWKNNLSKCQPIVFTATDHQVEIIDSGKEGYSDSLKDAPFEVFSIEMIDRPISSGSASEEDLEKYGASVSTHGLVFVEVSPNVYRSLCKFQVGTKKIRYCEVTDLNADGFYAMANALLKRMSSKASMVGTAHTRSRRLGNGESTRIRQVVYVASKKEYLATVSQDRKPINWSHRWLVRGHWRKNDTIGKDREGVYCVHGFTWVTDHEKGPDGAVLINKVRIVD